MENILKIIETLLTISGINVFVDFNNLHLFHKIYRLFCAFMVICVYTTSFYYDFWLATKIGLKLFLGAAVVGITTTVLRAILLASQRNKFVFLMNWLREVYQGGYSSVDESNTELEKVSEILLKAWR